MTWSATSPPSLPGRRRGEVALPTRSPDTKVLAEGTGTRPGQANQAVDKA